MRDQLTEQLKLQFKKQFDGNSGLKIIINPIQSLNSRAQLFEYLLPLTEG